MATTQYTVNGSASSDAQRFASYLARLKQIANETANWKAELDAIVDAGNTNVWGSMQLRLGLELAGVATDADQTQAVYNLVAGANIDMNGTEAAPAQTRQLVTSVAAK